MIAEDIRARSVESRETWDIRCLEKQRTRPNMPHSGRNDPMDIGSFGKGKGKYSKSKGKGKQGQKEKPEQKGQQGQQGLRDKARTRSNVGTVESASTTQRTVGAEGTMEHERRDRVFSAICVGIPWQLVPGQRRPGRPIVPALEVDLGVAPGL